MLGRYIEKFKEAGSVFLPVKAKAGLAKTRISGRLGDGTLKMEVKGVPEKGKANAEIIKYLAAAFKTDKEKVKIVSGKTGSKKIIKISSR